MELASAVHEDVYVKVATWMREVYGEAVSFDESRPVLGLGFGSARVEVRVEAWGADDAVIRARSVVVRDARVDAELMRFLLRANDDCLFGAFGLEENGSVVFQHTIVGSTCNPPELRSTVMGVLSAADRFDDEIVGKWGGKRAVD
ncbi:MAG: YbjN domain-containing protein [Deltaproteobacteria bacterium]|nr:YbjN domain-containing protein [Deltaproteobacteria bacterium]